jgi:hypothetical protein
MEAKGGHLRKKKLVLLEFRRQKTRLSQIVSSAALKTRFTVDNQEELVNLSCPSQFARGRTGVDKARN